MSDHKTSTHIALPMSSVSCLISLMTTALSLPPSAAAETIDELRIQLEQMEKRQQAERDEMKQRMARMEGVAPAPPEAPAWRVRMERRKPDQLRLLWPGDRSGIHGMSGRATTAPGNAGSGGRTGVAIRTPKVRPLSIHLQMNPVGNGISRDAPAGVRQSTGVGVHQRDLRATLSHIIHDRFYCDRRSTRCITEQRVPRLRQASMRLRGLLAGRLAPRGLNVLFQYASAASASAWGYPLFFRMQWVQTHGVLAVSSRSVMNNAGHTIPRPIADFQIKSAWTLLRASVAQPAGTGVLEPRPPTLH